MLTYLNLNLSKADDLYNIFNEVLFIFNKINLNICLNIRIIRSGLHYTIKNVP